MAKIFFGRHGMAVDFPNNLKLLSVLNNNSIKFANK